MGVIEDLADELAIETLALLEKTGDEDLIRQVGESLSASSTVTQEAFMASIRVRQAVARAREMLAAKEVAASKSAPSAE